MVVVAEVKLTDQSTDDLSLRTLIQPLLAAVENGGKKAFCLWRKFNGNIIFFSKTETAKEDSSSNISAKNGFGQFRLGRLRNSGPATG
jgi:hypothetical protein